MTIKKPALILSLLLALLALSACQPPIPAKPTTARALSSVTASAALGKLSISIHDATGGLVYSDASPSTSSSLNLNATKEYVLTLSEVNAHPGSSYSLNLSQINVVSGETTATPIALGNNPLRIDTQGDYAMKILVTEPDGTTLTASYLAAVSCANPTLTAASLDPSGISVTESAPNLFTLSAANVVARANGTAPYSCAWDPTGTGIRDTGFSDCGTPLTNFYSNFLGVRRVGLLVKDSCNTTVNIENAETFISQTPAMPGNVFISGQTTNATGQVAGDPRLDHVDYLATNAPNHNVVYASYDTGHFQISSSQNYFLSTSSSFGVRIQVTGLADSINLPAMTGTVSAAGAVITRISFSTDQAADHSTALALSGATCALSNQNANVTFQAGAPCASGSTGDQNRATVEVWGHFHCTHLSSAQGAIDFEGDFDGQSGMSDACTIAVQPNQGPVGGIPTTGVPSGGLPSGGHSTPSGGGTTPVQL